VINLSSFITASRHLVQEIIHFNFVVIRFHCTFELPEFIAEPPLQQPNKTCCTSAELQVAARIRDHICGHDTVWERKTLLQRISTYHLNEHDGGEK
jgi:hypothetical protein